MSHRHSKADWTAVILHEEAIAGESKDLAEPSHHLGEMVEGIGERRRCRAGAMAEAGIVGRDEAVSVGEACQQRLVHA